SRRRHTRFSRDWSSDVWLFRSEVMVTDLSEECAEVALHLTHRLTVHGRVTLAGEPVPGATVTMFHGAGEHAGHTTADDDGQWSRSEERRVGKECRTRAAAGRRQ